MTPETLSSAAGIVLSLAFAYVPGLQIRFEQLDSAQKRLAMALLLLIVAVAVFALSCSRVFAWIACDQAGAVQVVQLFIAALVANQAAYSLAVRPAQK